MKEVCIQSNLKTQLEWVSTLRGMAALLVFFSHLPLQMSYGTRFFIGRVGVTAFFLISGFLSVSSRRRMTKKQYLINRFIRIYPVYWLLLLLMCIVMEKEKLSIERIMANITCFQEFLGQENILGASWMLPIQIVFFLVIGIVGVKIYIGKQNCRIASITTVILCGILAIGLGVIRYQTGKPFPTAFFLLINVAFLGVFHRAQTEGSISNRLMCIILIVFEVSLIVAVKLSYKDMFWQYVGAYNLGLLLTWFVEKRQFDWKIFKQLGNIGFAFFLGADIPYVLLKRFADMESTVPLRIVGSVLKLILAIGFANLITKRFEKPLQKMLNSKLN